MGFVDFFIRRVVFAIVCAILIVIAGTVVIPGLPIAQYPQIALPQVVVTSSYVGASSAEVESGVTNPLEQQINGVQGMKYITSSSSNDGSSVITVTFDASRDIDLAAVDVQNRVNTALARLPLDVRNLGVTITKNSGAFIGAYALFTPDERYDEKFLSNYADVYMKDRLKRIAGVADVIIFGERRFSMRLWLDPDRLAARSMSPVDVLAALREQNVQVAAGSVGLPPAPSGQTYQISVRAVGRLVEASQFEDVVVKSLPDGTIVRLKDVGHAELGAEAYSQLSRWKGKRAVGLGIQQLPGSNALDVKKNVDAAMARLAKDFPPGLVYETAFDTTAPVSASIKDVIITLLQAILLVIATIFLFLQTLRSTLIPAITIPVSLLGTFAFVKLFGFSINTLTLFGLTLATGLVVDDAIVVIENISRVIEQQQVSPREAASKGMAEVTGAVIATSLVLVAVFVPVAFFPGTTGKIYQQFSLTIAFSIALSAFNAITLTPALSARLLRAEDHRPGARKNIFFRAFDRGLRRGPPQLRARPGAGDPPPRGDARSSSSACSAPRAGSSGTCRRRSFRTRTRGTSSSSSRGPRGRASRSRPTRCAASRTRWRASRKSRGASPSPASRSSARARTRARSSARSSPGRRAPSPGRTRCRSSPASAARSWAWGARS